MNQAKLGQPKIGNDFQNIDKALKRFGELNLNPFEELTELELTTLQLNIQKRHIIGHSQAFWQEFTFARSKFSPQPGQELELADNFVWLDDFAFALQLKQRTEASSDPDRERNWFKKKVLTNGTRQIRDTLRFLKAHDRIQLTNERGHEFDVRGSTLTDVTKIIVYFGSKALPEDCWQTRHHVSGTAGSIHVVAAHDYLGIVETLRVPKDIRDYFAYRQEVVLQLRDKSVHEPDIMGSFVRNELRPTPTSRNHLRSFVQDVQAFDLSFLIGRLHDHIQNGDGSQDYYQIMLEFARVPRSVWREVRTRFDLCFQAAKKAEFVAPFRFAFPGSSCTFMIAALDPKLPSAGVDGQRIRIGAHSLVRSAVPQKGLSSPPKQLWKWLPSLACLRQQPAS